MRRTALRRGRRSAIGAALVLPLATWTGACSKEPGAGDPAPAASAASSAAPKASASAAPEPPWFEGEWTGTTTVERRGADLEPKQGGLPQWKADDAKAATGPVTWQVVVDEAGSASGTATGALGALEGSGTMDEDRLSLDFEPADGSGFRGVLTARADTPGGAKPSASTKLVGKLQASSGDSAVVRGGDVTLEKKP